MTEIRWFKNGNCTVKFGPETLEEIRRETYNAHYVLSELLYWNDVVYIGVDPVYTWNDCGRALFNPHNNTVCRVWSSDLRSLELGERIRLIFRKPDEYEREFLRGEGLL